ncbi:hypothetical protein E2562_000974, partial [Oryza meyeriana var. granulata]
AVAGEGGAVDGILAPIGDGVLTAAGDVVLSAGGNNGSGDETFAAASEDLDGT